MGRGLGYRKSIKELHSELEDAAKRLSDAVSARDIASRETSVLLKQSEDLKADISKKQSLAEGLDNSINVKKQELSILDKKLSERESNSNAYLTLIDNKIDISSKKLAEINAELAKKPEQEKELQEIKDETIRFSKRLFSLRTENEIERNSIENDRAQIIKEREQLESLKKLVDKISNKNEVDRGKLEVYVKRLQMYYNEHGIKLNILPTFNIKADN